MPRRLRLRAILDKPVGGCYLVAASRDRRLLRVAVRLHAQCAPGHLGIGPRGRTDRTSGAPLAQLVEQLTLNQ